jgi:HEAT repeats
MSIEIVPPFDIPLVASGELTFSPDQLNLVRNVITGRDTSFPRTQAIGLLRASNVPDKYRDFQLLLENEQESPSVRYLAARSLGRINTPEAVEILIKNSQICDEYVLTGVMLSLGRIGDRKTLEVISRVKESATGLAASQAEFAAALISHRLGLEGNDLPIPNSSEYLELSGSAASSFQVTQVSETGIHLILTAIRRHLRSLIGAIPSRLPSKLAELRCLRETEVEVCLRSLATQPFGIEYSENNLYQIQCGRNNWMLILNKEFTNQDAVQALQSRKAFPGIIAARYEETGSYSTAFLLFTSPTEQPNILNLLVHRSTGEQIFGGTAQVEGGKANFSIRSISRPGGFPVNVEGTFEGGNLNFETTLSGTQVQERRHPTKVRSSLA